MAAEYAGDLMPKDAWTMLANEPRSVLVDVRTLAEWSFVGVPDLSGLGKEPIYVSWVVFPSMEQNPSFAADIQRQVPDPDVPVLFLCRSGGRSRAAAIAMTQRGYRQCYNVATGFEGDKDSAQHRNSLCGWRSDKLPWAQS